MARRSGSCSRGGDASGLLAGGGDLRTIPLVKERDFFEDLQTATRQIWPQPKMLVISFPHNPTTEVVDLAFFRRVVAFAREHEMMVIHDLAYADLVFDGYTAPSILQVPGAKDVAVELYSMSKGYSMPGWRVGFVVGTNGDAQRVVGDVGRVDVRHDQQVRLVGQGYV